MPAPASVHPKICKLSARIGSVLTNIANINAFNAADAGDSFEWKMHANRSLWIDDDHIFRRSDTLTFSGVG
jgi:hypothetical protein